MRDRNLRFAIGDLRLKSETTRRQRARRDGSIPNHKSKIQNRPASSPSCLRASVPSCLHSPAFTLIEVMVSIALVLILVLGINEVFKMAADTVGTGQALSAKTRDGRALQAVINNELQHLVREQDQPFFIIDSRTQLAFRNAADQQSDLDYNPSDTGLTRQQHILSIDLNGDNKEGNAPGETLNLAEPSLRNHRVDTLSFFTRDLYPRQTGNSSGTNNVYVDDMSSNEAWVTYGHLRVYDPNTNAPNAFTSYKPLGDGGPGFAGKPLDATSNPKNFYADDWVLGRVAMLLVKPVGQSTTSAGLIYDRSTPTPQQQSFWALPPSAVVPNPNYKDLMPFGRNTSPLPAEPITIGDARYDLIGSTLSDFKSELKTYIEHTKYRIGPAQAPAYRDEWWWQLPCDPTTNATLGYGRFSCNPYPTKPLDARKAAQTSPILLNNCTQFIVEFAGDYFTQTDVTTTNPPTSQITALAPDGVLDHYYDPKTGVRHIRWYGFPRDLDGNGKIQSYTPSMTNGNDDQLTDVVPVRDVAMTFNVNYNVMAPSLLFERHIVFADASLTAPTTSLPLPPSGGDYAAPGVLGTNNYYTAAWGPNDTNRPKMLRIIATVDDPNGRLSDGQTFEYVINLP